MTAAARYQPLKQDVREVATCLKQAYGSKAWRSHAPPLDQLIATILSQHTSDANAERAFGALKVRFADWNAIRTAPVSAVEDAIRPGGLAAIKARRIQGILNENHAEWETLDLDHLDAMPLDQARRWLLGLHGVGPKTAACVLLFSLGKPALPVDTHVYRVSHRLGILPSRVSPEAAHTELEQLFGDDLGSIYDFHLNAIAHGRGLCKARAPRCDRCLLHDGCAYRRQSELHG